MSPHIEKDDALDEVVEIDDAEEWDDNEEFFDEEDDEIIVDENSHL